MRIVIVFDNFCSRFKMAKQDKTMNLTKKRDSTGRIRKYSKFRIPVFLLFCFTATQRPTNLKTSCKVRSSAAVAMDRNGMAIRCGALLGILACVYCCSPGAPPKEHKPVFFTILGVYRKRVWQDGEKAQEFCPAFL